MKTRSSLVSLIHDGKVEATLCQDGYFIDSRGHKLFVMKREPLELIKTILEDFQEPELIVTDATKVVKYNGVNPFETSDSELMRRLLSIIYCSDNIKFPQPDLVEVLDLIQADLAVKKC